MTKNINTMYIHIQVSSPSLCCFLLWFERRAAICYYDGRSSADRTFDDVNAKDLKWAFAVDQKYRIEMIVCIFSFPDPSQILQLSREKCPAAVALDPSFPVHCR